MKTHLLYMCSVWTGRISKKCSFQLDKSLSLDLQDQTIVHILLTQKVHPKRSVPSIMGLSPTSLVNVLSSYTGQGFDL